LARLQGQAATLAELIEKFDQAREVIDSRFAR